MVRNFRWCARRKVVLRARATDRWSTTASFDNEGGRFAFGHPSGALYALGRRLALPFVVELPGAGGRGR